MIITKLNDDNRLKNDNNDADDGKNNDDNRLKNDNNDTDDGNNNDDNRLKNDNINTERCNCRCLQSTYYTWRCLQHAHSHGNCAMSK